MFIKRENTDDCVIAGFAILDQKEKEFEGRQFVEVAVNVGKNAQGEDLPLINVSVWRKLFPFKKGDHVLACGEFKATKKDDKTYYSISADFVMKENSTKIVEETQPELTEIEENDDLPF